jgi:hypothetical protein
MRGEKLARSMPLPGWQMDRLLLAVRTGMLSQKHEILCSGSMRFVSANADAVSQNLIAL